MIGIKRWTGVCLLAVGTFVVGSDAHSVAGLLPSMATDLRSSIPLVGQSVTVFAIAYAVLSPLLTIKLAHWSYRKILVLALGVFAAGNIATAIAPAVPWLSGGRVIAAGGAALFTPLAGAVATGLVRTDQRGRALAIITAGVASALVFGAPVSAGIAAVTSWRVTLWVLAALGLLMFLALVLFLPTLPTTAVPAKPLSVLGDRQIRRTLAITLVAFAGVFIPYTYMSQAYGPLVTSIPGGMSGVLLLFGLSSVVGALSSGPLADRIPARWFTVAVLVALATVDVVVVFGRGSKIALVLSVLLAGYLSWSILVPQQRQLLEIAPERAATLLSLNASAGYVGIAAAGLVGGIALAAVGIPQFVLLGSAFLAIAAAWRALPVGCNR